MNELDGVSDVGGIGGGIGGGGGRVGRFGRCVRGGGLGGGRQRRGAERVGQHERDAGPLLIGVEVQGSGFEIPG